MVRVHPSSYTIKRYLHKIYSQRTPLLRGYESLKRTSVVGIPDAVWGEAKVVAVPCAGIERALDFNDLHGFLERKALEGHFFRFN